ncbi:TraB/GumN family protein [Pelomonas sp. KK5]|uniref:TraB/GumN family protein n=1 Tax=Pelomonas sp. KK5 TaxID=1855730 RepID=UPI00097C77C8|nr:TraB/GumN family protein [Pelomonas sp. KK5]
MPAAHLLRTTFSLLLALLASTAHAATDCPAPVAPPTPEQLAAAAAAATQDHGLLWRARRDGHDSYLYGTLHVGRLAWAMPGPQQSQAWQATDTLALELDISDPQTVRALTSGVPAPALSAKTKGRIAAQIAAECLPAGALAAMHPLMQLSTLTVLTARRDELDAGYAQEAILLGMAQAAKRRVVALETPQEQLDALIPKDPRELQRALDDGLTQLERKEVRAPMLKLARAWAASDLPLLQTYEDWCDCIHDEADRRYMHGLLAARNPRIAERFAALHAGGQRVFVAVGALHMVGPEGLPAQLKKMGFELTRLVPAP